MGPTPRVPVTALGLVSDLYLGGFDDFGLGGREGFGKSSFSPISSGTGIFTSILGGDLDAARRKHTTTRARIVSAGNLPSPDSSQVFSVENEGGGLVFTGFWRPRLMGE